MILIMKEEVEEDYIPKNIIIKGVLTNVYLFREILKRGRLIDQIRDHSISTSTSTPSSSSSNKKKLNGSSNNNGGGGNKIKNINKKKFDKWHRYLHYKDIFDAEWVCKNGYFKLLQYKLERNDHIMFSVRSIEYLCSNIDNLSLFLYFYNHPNVRPFFYGRCILEHCASNQRLDSDSHTVIFNLLLNQKEPEPLMVGHALSTAIKYGSTPIVKLLFHNFQEEYVSSKMMDRPLSIPINSNNNHHQFNFNNFVLPTNNYNNSSSNNCQSPSPLSNSTSLIPPPLPSPSSELINELINNFPSSFNLVSEYMSKDYFNVISIGDPILLKSICSRMVEATSPEHSHHHLFYSNPKTSLHRQYIIFVESLIQLLFEEEIEKNQIVEFDMEKLLQMIVVLVSYRVIPGLTSEWMALELPDLGQNHLPTIFYLTLAKSNIFQVNFVSKCFGLLLRSTYSPVNPQLIETILDLYGFDVICKFGSIEQIQVAHLHILNTLPADLTLPDHPYVRGLQLMPHTWNEEIVEFLAKNYQEVFFKPNQFNIAIFDNQLEMIEFYARRSYDRLVEHLASLETQYALYCLPSTLLYLTRICDTMEFRGCVERPFPIKDLETAQMILSKNPSYSSIYIKFVPTNDREDLDLIRFLLDHLISPLNRFNIIIRSFKLSCKNGWIKMTQYLAPIYIESVKKFVETSKNDHLFGSIVEREIIGSRTPLDLALKYQQFDIVDLLLPMIRDDNRSFLGFSKSSFQLIGKLGSIEYFNLVINQFNCNHKVVGGNETKEIITDCLTFAMKYGRLDLIAYIFNHQDNYYQCVDNGVAINLLALGGSDKISRKELPMINHLLSEAIQDGDHQHILDYFLDPSTRPLAVKDHIVESYLIYQAIKCGQIACCKLLMDKFNLKESDLINHGIQKLHLKYYFQV